MAGTCNTCARSLRKWAGGHRGKCSICWSKTANRYRVAVQRKPTDLAALRRFLVTMAERMPAKEALRVLADVATFAGQLADGLREELDEE